MEKEKNFSLYKTLYLTRKNPYELPNHRKDSFRKFYYHDDFVNGEIELGKRYRVEVFSIFESWTLKIDDYLDFFESHKDKLIGAQVSDVDWYDLGDYIGKRADCGIGYNPLKDNLWVDSSKKCWVPQIDLFLIPFYFFLGCINPDWDADQNCVFLFYPFEEGTEDLYIPSEKKTEDLFEPSVSTKEKTEDLCESNIHKDKKKPFSFLWKLFQ